MVTVYTALEEGTFGLNSTLCKNHFARINHSVENLYSVHQPFKLDLIRIGGEQSSVCLIIVKIPPLFKTVSTQYMPKSRIPSLGMVTSRHW